MTEALIIETDKVVTLIYKVFNENKELVDSTDRDAPFQYLHGHSNIVPGLEAQLTGLAAGYSGTISVPNAYGETVPELVQVVDRKLFTGLPEGQELAVGLSFLASTAGGDIPVRVTKIEGDKVTVDANLELAGQTLTFEVEIVGVRNATIDELALGYPASVEGVAPRQKM